MMLRLGAVLVTVLLYSVLVGFTEGNNEKEERETTGSSDSSTSVEYGIDCSFPMTTSNGAGCPDKVLFGSQQELYDANYRRYMDGCRRRYSNMAERCDANEEQRLEMNLAQPRGMENYTSAGYAKVKTPPAVWKVLSEYWNLHKDSAQEERWPKGNIFVNHWESPTSILRLFTFKPSDWKPLETRVYDGVKPVVEAWTGQSLVPTSLYGIRVYKEGSILSPHVDRLPLVSSAIINIDQDVDEPWPLEVVGHDGIARNMTLEPGDMLLYESHSIIHGRPFPLRGRYYANLFVHFEPIGHTKRHSASGSYGAQFVDNKEIKALYEEAMTRKTAPQLQRGDQSDLPDYIQEGTDEAKMWRQEYMYKEEKKPGKPKKEKSLLLTANEPEGMSPHTAAAHGQLAALIAMKDRDPALLHKRDENGWQPLHEAARAGHKHVLEFLIDENGADINARTNQGKGATALWWAEQIFDERHPAVVYLREKGATNKAPQK